MNEFENSFKGLKIIICNRKLYKKTAYLISGSIIVFFNLVFYIFKYYVTDIEYYEILKAFVNVFSPTFITFCGFTMTAYSLVVGFLNYGIFKSSIEAWYRNKIEQRKEPSQVDDLSKFSIYQEGIALFALAIILLLATVLFFLIVKFIVELNIIVDWKIVEFLNAIILMFAILLCNYSFILIFYNILNIFTFSQLLNELVYYEELKKDEDENNKSQNPEEE